MVNSFQILRFFEHHFPGNALWNWYANHVPNGNDHYLELETSRESPSSVQHETATSNGCRLE